MDATYATTDCCVGTFVAESLPIASSSITIPKPAVVVSDNIRAPAALTFVASVTSALASIAFNLV